MGTASLAKPAVMTIRKLSQCPDDKRGGCPGDPGAVQAGQALGSLNPGRLPACSRPRAGGGGSNLVTCSGVLLLLAEPQIEFEMRNPEPSCLCCEREACWQVFPPPPSALEEGTGEAAPNSPRGEEQASLSRYDGEGHG